MAIILLVITLLAVAVSASAASFTIPFKFPLFKQCDQPWANDIMDTKTICSVGCLMTSTVMVREAFCFRTLVLFLLKVKKHDNHINMNR